MKRASKDPYRVMVTEDVAQRAAEALRERVASAEVFAGNQAQDEIAAETLEGEINRVRMNKRQMARDIVNSWKDRNF